jgi:mannitol/fructose-specific phosphotransferase system IIA component (Ntr-type)
VDTVIMLAMGVHGGGQDQLRLFSRLARRLVTDDFRGRLAACTDGPTVLALMDEALADDD